MSLVVRYIFVVQGQPQIFFKFHRFRVYFVNKTFSQFVNYCNDYVTSNGIMDETRNL